MGFFKRRAAPVSVHPIAGFWQWWVSDAAGRFSAAVDTGQWGELPAEMSPQVAAVHPGLAWDTGAGRAARSLLTVSSEGDPGLRRIAEQLLRAAPAADKSWEFAAARQPNSDAVDSFIEIDGHGLHLGDARFRIAEDFDRERLDIGVHHPLFADMSEGVPLRVSFLLLDWILGEDDVERWVGAVDTADVSETAAATAADLTASVKAMAAQSQPDRWALLEGSTRNGKRSIVTARRPLRWIDYPVFDLHSQIWLAFEDERGDGLPTARSLDLLREIEDDISAALGFRGILVAHETAAGTRVLHYYSDSEDQNGRDALETTARAAGGTTRHASDPGWSRVRQFS
ncbi:DUF695 domain-containing protein [Arthrobacter sp. OAP107]|uniref:DUF695 domain-containing protein n=1 Tax=Arthrobacter sp. OAP107 TaxID=3156445 RepID=UPI003397C615